MSKTRDILDLVDKINELQKELFDIKSCQQGSDYQKKVRQEELEINIETLQNLLSLAKKMD